MPRLSHISASTKAKHRFSTSERKNPSQVDRTAVACPTCGASVGVRCATPSGGPTLHVARERLTTRLHNERMAGAWDLLVRVKKVTHKERRAIVARLGVTYREVADDLAVPYASLLRWFHDLQPPATEAGLRFAEWVLSEVDR